MKNKHYYELRIHVDGFYSNVRYIWVIFAYLIITQLNIRTYNFSWVFNEKNSTI